MPSRRRADAIELVRRILLIGAVGLAATACSGGKSASPTLTTMTTASTISSASSAGSPSDWPLFGYTAARANSGPSATGITAADVVQLRRPRALALHAGGLYLLGGDSADHDRDARR